jgi:hypothetical protein
MIEVTNKKLRDDFVIPIGNIEYLFFQCEHKEKVKAQKKAASKRHGLHYNG